MARLWCLWCAWLWCGWLGGGAGALRVLGVVPVASKSHHAVLQALLKGLAQRGHSVVSIEYQPPDDAPINYTSVVVDNSYMDVFKGSFNPFSMSDMPYVQRMSMLWSWGFLMSDAILQQPQVQALARGDMGDFDVLVMEAFFNEAFLGLAHLLDAPVVQVCPYVGSAWMYGAVGSPASASYVPDPFLPYNDRMTFPQRLTHFLFGVFQELVRELYYLPEQERIMRRWLGEGGARGRGPLPPLKALERSTALMLVNSHVAVSYPRPVTPNLVLVGGLHVRPARALPTDLDRIISNSSNGVIYFSMGSALQSTQMQEKKMADILKVLGELKHLVIMKWEADVLPGRPANVETRKWLPQNDILAHPKVKLFITHGGLLSSFEALYYGIPLVGIPIFGDQQLNMERAEIAGYGIKIAYSDLSASTLRGALKEVLSNKRYKENAERLSGLLRDQPESPLERAMWWVEYIVRHKGAPHMQSAARDQPWYRNHLVDVLAGLLGALSILIIVSAWVTLFLCRKLFSKESKTSLKDTAKKRK